MKEALDPEEEARKAATLSVNGKKSLD